MRCVRDASFFFFFPLSTSLFGGFLHFLNWGSGSALGCTIAFFFFEQGSLGTAFVSSVKLQADDGFPFFFCCTDFNALLPFFIIFLFFFIFLVWGCLLNST